MALHVHASVHADVADNVQFHIRHIEGHAENMHVLDIGTVSLYLTEEEITGLAEMVNGFRANGYRDEWKRNFSHGRMTYRFDPAHAEKIEPAEATA